MKERLLKERHILQFRLILELCNTKCERFKHVPAYKVDLKGTPRSSHSEISLKTLTVISHRPATTNNAY
jgi:hypothetical protein